MILVSGNTMDQNKGTHTAEIADAVMFVRTMKLLPP